MYELRIWKWLMPAMALPALFVVAVVLSDVGNDLAWTCAGGLVMLMPVLAVQAWAGFRAYYREVDVSQKETLRRALADSAEVRLFEYARLMHPETVRLLLKHRREVWRVRELKGEDLCTWVLDADPRVNVGFLEHVLKHSNFYSIMPKRLLSDKAHSFDHEGAVTDYEQYDALVALLMRRGWLTAGFGNQPGAWIEPWNPELVGRRFGIELYDDDPPSGSGQVVDDGRLVLPVENKA